MGRRDFPGRQKKKPRKEAKKAPAISLESPVAQVEVIRVKGKKEKETEG